jgi:hypothetical protein
MSLEPAESAPGEETVPGNEAMPADGDPVRAAPAR